MRNKMIVSAVGAAVLLAVACGVANTENDIAAWRALAEQGYAEAQCVLGGAYAEGRGVPQDDTEAAKWFRKAGDQDAAAEQSTVANKT